MAEPPRELLGTWRLRDAGVNDAAGKLAMPLFAPNPQGLLCYNADGFMFVHLMKSGRHSDDEAEHKHPDQAYYGYCGRYEIRGDQVIHHIEISRDIQALGKPYRRWFRIEGPLLHLSWERGNDHIGWIIWERV